MANYKLIPNTLHAINLDHSPRMRMRVDNKGVYTLEVCTVDPDDTISITLKHIASDDQARDLLEQLVGERGEGDWSVSSADLQRTVDELETANEEGEAKLSRAGQALAQIARSIRELLRLLDSTLEGAPVRTKLGILATFTEDERRALGLTERDLSDGMAKLFASIPTDEHEPDKIEMLVNDPHTLVDPIPRALGAYATGEQLVRSWSNLRRRDRMPVIDRLPELGQLIEVPGLWPLRDHEKRARYRGIVTHVGHDDRFTLQITREGFGVALEGDDYYWGTELMQSTDTSGDAGWQFAGRSEQLVSVSLDQWGLCAVGHRRGVGEKDRPSWVPYWLPVRHEGEDERVRELDGKLPAIAPGDRVFAYELGVVTCTNSESDAMPNCVRLESGVWVPRVLVYTAAEYVLERGERLVRAEGWAIGEDDTNDGHEFTLSIEVEVATLDGEFGDLIHYRGILTDHDKTDPYLPWKLSPYQELEPEGWVDGHDELWLGFSPRTEANYRIIAWRLLDANPKAPNLEPARTDLVAILRRVAKGETLPADQAAAARALREFGVDE